MFLIVFLDVKLAVKITALVLIYITQPGFKFGFSLKNPRLPLFYPAIMLIGLTDVALNKSYAVHNYVWVALVGLVFWLICILAVHQVKHFVERHDSEIIHRTIIVFFVLNATVSLVNMAAIIWETHALNPYLYQGEYQKYFISTGDFIKGITFDTSTTNAVLNAMGVIYFLDKKNAFMTLLCMAILILTGSNFTNIILLVILAGLFIFKSTRNQKSLIAICLMFLVVFMGRISPQNNDYVVNAVKSLLVKKKVISKWPTAPHIIPIAQLPDSQLNPVERKQKIALLYIDSVNKANAKYIVPDPLPKKVPVAGSGKILVPKPNLDAPNYQWLRVTPPGQMQLLQFAIDHKAELPISARPFHFSPIPGKLTGFIQTINFFKQHPSNMISGIGMGNFSSKLAFRATGLNFSGGYPQRLAYINPFFMANHLDIYLNYFSKNPELHSLTNSPFSVYDQILSEYGLLGLAALAVFYFWFFARHYKKLSYGIPLLCFVAAIFFIDYWFEQLSVLIMFELMLFLNIKEKERIAEVRKVKVYPQTLFAS